MKRIIITLAALAVSSFAYAENLDSYASVLNDDPAPFIQYRDKSPTYLENHGDVLIDQLPPSRSRVVDQTLQYELSIGSQDSSLFDSDPDNQF